MNDAKSCLFVNLHLLRLRIINAESVHGNALHLLFLQGTVVIIRPGLSDLINNLDTLRELAKCCILAV